MEKQFVTYEIALVMKELGFDEHCFAMYCHHGKPQSIGLFTGNDPSKISKRSSFKLVCKAPLWQQCMDWLREKYNLHITIQRVIGNKGTDIESESWTFEGTPWKTYSTYQEAREQAVLKCIELCKQKE